MFHAELDQLAGKGVKIGVQSCAARTLRWDADPVRLIIVQSPRRKKEMHCAPPAPAAPMTRGFRLAAASGLHRGDRPYQQDQVLMLGHPRVQGCVMAVVAD